MGAPLVLIKLWSTQWHLRQGLAWQLVRDRWWWMAALIRLWDILSGDEALGMKKPNRGDGDETVK